MFEVLNQQNLKFSKSEFSKQQKKSFIFSLESGETLQTHVGNNEEHSSVSNCFFHLKSKWEREVPSFGLASSEDIKLIEK